MLLLVQRTLELRWDLWHLVLPENLWLQDLELLEILVVPVLQWHLVLRENLLDR
jgi:hypothetical protein